MKTINLDRTWTKVLLTIAIAAAVWGLVQIFTTMAQ